MSIVTRIGEDFFLLHQGVKQELYHWHIRGSMCVV
jgi:hypothetical protein